MSGARAILLGAGGHGRVVRHLATAAGLRVDAVCDPALRQGAEWEGLAVLGGDDALAGQVAVLLNGIGKLPGSGLRAALQRRLVAAGFAFPPLLHPFAWVAPGVALGAGGLVMAGAVLQPGVRIGAGSIVNTRAGVDHDCDLGEDVHVAPGATLCGDVVLDDGAFIGAGATVLPGLRVGAGAVVGAGCTLRRDLAPGDTWTGRKKGRQP